MSDALPSYVGLHSSGELERRARTAQLSLAHCELCPHRCGANRLAGELGRCRMGAEAVVAAWNLHMWEEPPISGTAGSGTIFFSGCTGHCRFCQNYPISQLGVGQQVSRSRFAEMMLELQRRGAHNINFVTPTHFVGSILGSLPRAVEMGLRLPLVYNSSGFERVETLRWLDGVIDIWLPDAKYADRSVALDLSGFPDYVTHNRAALEEMHRQVGPDLRLGQDGPARRGLIVRHLVLPDDLAGTAEVLQWVAARLSTRVHVSLMSQYFPAHECVGDATLGRRITEAEYCAAVAALEERGFEHGWVQEWEQ